MNGYADGAGCLTADDYGDAPVSYGTRTARHNMVGGLRIGGDVDAEHGPGPDVELNGLHGDNTVAFATTSGPDPDPANNAVDFSLVPGPVDSDLGVSVAGRPRMFRSPPR